MKTKKVFSTQKYYDWCLAQYGKVYYKDPTDVWVVDCEGLTEAEINEIGYGCSISWLIEVEDKPKKLGYFKDIVDSIDNGYVFDIIKLEEDVFIFCIGDEVYTLTGFNKEEK